MKVDIAYCSSNLYMKCTGISILSLYENNKRSSKDVKKLTLEKIKEIDKKLEELLSLRKELSYLVDHCYGDDKPNCPIIDELSKN